MILSAGAIQLLMNTVSMSQTFARGYELSWLYILSIFRVSLLIMIYLKLHSSLTLCSPNSFLIWRACFVVKM